MQFSDIRKMLGGGGEGPRLAANAEVKGIALHSRDVRPGWVFVAIPGNVTDGLSYVEDAVRRGALAIVAEHTPPVRVPVPVIPVPDARGAAAELAAAFHGYPARKLALAAVTGTNGKTTTAMMIRAALRHAGLEPGLIGTVAYEAGARIIPASRTTPDALTLQDLLRQMVGAGCRSAVLEVSSHALVQQRVAGLDFAAAAFTNLTHDHLDYHGGMEAYFEAKTLLFRGLAETATAVINHDDPWGRRLWDIPLAARRLSYGLDASSVDIRAESVALSLDGATFRLLSPWGEWEARIGLPGRYNVSNALAGFGVCAAMGVAPDTVLEALASVTHVRGRLERVQSTAPFRVFVDYAHTDDALRHVIGALRPLTEGRLILVFGCGGNRDRAKRAPMGAVAAERADVAIVTSDNPRNEDPTRIIEDILEGAVGDHVRVIASRREAIAHAVAMAVPGDTVLIAGKGHETYQEYEGRVTPFNDVEVARQALDDRSRAS